MLAEELILENTLSPHGNLESATARSILELNEEGLLAEVLGYETKEVASWAMGSAVRTFSGTQFIDFTGGIAVHACGHNHPEIVNAIVDQAARVLHTSDIFRHAPQLRLAAFMREKFAQAIPGNPWSILFLNSGSESIDASAKLAAKVTGRSKFIAFDGAFHGRTLFATALSRSKELHWSAYEQFLSALDGNILHAPSPSRIDCGPDSDYCCLPELERIIEREAHEIAAVYFEAEQGEGGYRPMSPTLARSIRQLTADAGILLIADEVQSGWGRTGKWFGFEHLGIEPDIVVFGKAIGGGLPLAGVAAPRQMMDLWEPGEHGTTFGGNPLACAAGLAALTIVERDNLVERAAVLGREIEQRLSPLVGTNGIADVRGLGLMMAIELRDAAGLPDWERCDTVKAAARRNGLLLLTCGAKIGNPLCDCSAIRLIPPLTISDSTLHSALDILLQALEEEPMRPIP